jgi:hypothetical protein
VTLGQSKARRLGKEEEKEKKKKQEKQEEKNLEYPFRPAKLSCQEDTVTKNVCELKAKFKLHPRFEVLTVVTLKSDQVWDVTPSILVHTVISVDVLLHLLFSLKEEVAKCLVFVGIYTNLQVVTSQTTIFM